jgi:hypothetical protein
MFEAPANCQDMVVPELDSKVEPASDLGIFTHSIANIFTATKGGGSVKKEPPAVVGFSAMIASTTTQPAAEASINYAKFQHAQAEGAAARNQLTTTTATTATTRPKATGLAELDSLGLLDGLVSPRSATVRGSLWGVPAVNTASSTTATASASIQTPPAFTGALAFFGSQSQGSSSSSNDAHAAVMDGRFDDIAEVPEHDEPAPLATPSFAASAPSDSPFQSRANTPDVPMANEEEEEEEHHHQQQQHQYQMGASPSPRRRSSRAQQPSKRFGGGVANADKWTNEEHYDPSYSPSRSSPSSFGGRAGKRTGNTTRLGSSSTTAPTIDVYAPLSATDASGALPLDHKPARGRGRQLQLAKMSPAQRKAETKARLEKNRQAAKGFRARRKDHVQDLELAIADYEHRDQQQMAAIADLKRQIGRMQGLVKAEIR